MGGQLALFAGSEYPDRIGAVVDFYGVHPNVHPKLEQLSGPVLFNFATRDTSTSPEKANALVKTVEASGQHADAYFYEADHAFFNDQRPKVYDPAAADLAWQRTLDFFRGTLHA
jgi:carboxymethylenebutenolidase